MSIFNLIKDEWNRQQENIELIASENFVSEDILKAMGSCLTNKYAEGYPNNRYYGGCEVVDKIEHYCISRWKEVFNTNYHVNVQPHSGSQANLAAYQAVLKPGDTILSMDLNNGGHLTHGSSVNASGKLYNIISYNVDENGFIDYEDIEKKIRLYEPKLILAGASAYSREIDFFKIRQIIEKVKVERVIMNQYYQPYFMVDMAHIAGLIATGLHQTPFGIADIITTTTHKTLRGPHGGLIFCKPEFAKKIDSAIFPGSQGGPLMNIIAAKAVCADEALSDSYKTYMYNVVKNASAMAEEFINLGYDVITGGTDNHLFLIDFSRTHPNLTGQDVQNLLDKYKITLNKNCVPNEKRSPKLTSGIRIGTPAMTTRGWKEKDFIECARKIDRIIKENYHDCMRSATT